VLIDSDVKEKMVRMKLGLVEKKLTVCAVEAIRG
jgi:hypothetical protein